MPDTKQVISKVTIPTDDLVRVGKGALFAAAGAFLAYLAAHVSELNFGDMTPIIVAGVIAGIHYIQKMIAQWMAPQDVHLVGGEKPIEGETK